MRPRVRKCPHERAEHFRIHTDIGFAGQTGLIPHGVGVGSHQKRGLAGAGPAVEPLLIALESLPQVRERLQSITRVSDRRWNIELMSGAIVALPEQGAADALVRLERLQSQHALLDRPLSHIDMRVPHRMAVRVHPTLAGGPRMLLGGA